MRALCCAHIFFFFFQWFDLVFDLTWVSLELDLVIVKTKFITKFHDDPLKNEASILCTQSFSVIWPCDLVFEPTLPVSDLVLDIIHRNIWMKFQKYSMENEAYSVCTRFFLDYTYWPSFLPEVAHIWTWPKHWHKKNNILTNFCEHSWKMKPLLCTQGFSIIWSSNLVFKPTWPIF